MYRYVIGFLIVVGLGYWAYSSWQNHIESEKKRIEQETQREVLKNAVAEMAGKDNAASNWAESLAGGKRSRRSTVLSAELQKLWLIKRPILFIGNIKDIALNEDGTYQVMVEYNRRPRFLLNDIRINLRCPESIATKLIQAVTSERVHVYAANAAVTGVIERIETTSERESDEDTTDTITVLTGVGKCVNALYLTEQIYW